MGLYLSVFFMPPYCPADHGNIITALDGNFVVVTAAVVVVVTFCAPRSNFSWMQLCVGMSA
jgi:hypothetical protein